MLPVYDDKSAMGRQGGSRSAAAINGNTTITQKNIMTNNSPYGSDLKLAEFALGADLQISKTGDFEVTSEEMNLAQAILHRLRTVKGELAELGHPEYGSTIYNFVGQPNNWTTRARLRLAIRDTLRQETRIKEIVSISVNEQAANTEGELSADGGGTAATAIASKHDTRGSVKEVMKWGSRESSSLSETELLPSLGKDGNDEDKETNKKQEFNGISQGSGPQGISGSSDNYYYNNNNNNNNNINTVNVEIVVIPAGQSSPIGIAFPVSLEGA